MGPRPQLLALDLLELSLDNPRPLLLTKIFPITFQLFIASVIVADFIFESDNFCLDKIFESEVSSFVLEVDVDKFLPR